MQNSAVETSMPESWSVKKLTDGTFVLCEYGKQGQSEYAYDDVDQLLSAMRDDLTEGQEEGDEKHEKKEKSYADKLTQAEEDDDDEE